MSKAKISDVRQGVTLYYVHAFPHRGKNRSYFQPYVVSKSPVAVNGFKNSLFAEAKHFYDDDLSTGSYTQQFSLRDAGIIPNKYNFHMTFTSLKKAKRYAARMDRVCLSAAERVKFNKLQHDDFMLNE